METALRAARSRGHVHSRQRFGSHLHFRDPGDVALEFTSSNDQLPVGALDRNQGALKNQMFTLVGSGSGVDIGERAQVVVLEWRFTTSFLKNVQRGATVDIRTSTVER